MGSRRRTVLVAWVFSLISCATAPPPAPATHASAAVAPAPAGAPAPGANLEGGAAKLHSVKELVFADDVALFLSGKRAPMATPPSAPDPIERLTQAWARKDAGDVSGARAILRQFLGTHPEESRVELLFWSALRQLSEAPGVADATRVLGVVLEVPEPRGLDTLAAYADGRARYFNQAGGAVIWEQVTGKESDLVREVVKQGQQAVEMTPPVARHAPYGGGVRVTLLTPGGLRVKEGASFDEIGDGSLGPTLGAAAYLPRALVDATLGPGK